MRAIVLSVALSLLAPLAHAADDVPEASRLFSEGLARSEKKDYEGARVKFAEAYTKFPSPNALLNLARAEQLSDHPVEAIGHYRSYIALPENPRVTTKDRETARSALDECVAKVGRIDVKAPRGTRVMIDGATTATTEGEPIPVRVGDHKVELTNDQGTRTRSLNAPAGLVTVVQWDDPKSVVPPPMTTPSAPMTNPVASDPAPHDDRTFWGWRSATGLGGVVLGAVGIGVGIGFAIDRGHQADTALQLAGQIPQGSNACATPSATCTDYNHALQARNSDATMSTVFLVTGGVLVAAGAALLIWSAASPDKKHIALLPMVGPAWGGQLSASF